LRELSQITILSLFDIIPMSDLTRAFSIEANS
jgi:hypothetical protein